MALEQACCCTILKLNSGTCPGNKGCLLGLVNSSLVCIRKVDHFEGNLQCGQGLITCRRGSAKRAKIAVALTPTSCLHLTTTFFTDKQHKFPHLESHSHQLTYHPFDRNSPSTLAVLILHPPTNALLPPRSQPPNLSLFCSTHTTRSAPFPQFPESHPPLAGMSSHPSHAPACLLPPPQILEPHSTVSHGHLPRPDCMAALPSLLGDGKG